MTEFQAAVLTEQFRRFKTQDKTRQRNGQYVEKHLAEISGLTPRKRYTRNTRITYVRFEMDYDRARFNRIPAARFAEAVRAEGIPMGGGERTYRGACHKEKMLQEHLNSSAFKASFSKARLDKYRRSLHLPMMDEGPSSPKEMLWMDSKIPFLGSRREMDEIIEAVRKVARSVDQLA
jgi:dTDP-4-amino-4,6-dideoxygalactose transaminase